jgi:hypothetical protein
MTGHIIERRERGFNGFASVNMTGHLSMWTAIRGCTVTFYSAIGLSLGSAPTERDIHVEILPNNERR